MPNQPKVGVGVMVMKDGKVLLGKRKGSHGAGEYAFPGGHLEHMESFEKCARREVLEETGGKIGYPRFLFVANLEIYAPKHYAHIGLVAEWWGEEPKIMEPKKCEGWAWYDLDNLPQPLFHAVELSIIAYRTGQNYFDIETGIITPPGLAH